MNIKKISLVVLFAGALLAGNLWSIASAKSDSSNQQQPKAPSATAPKAEEPVASEARLKQQNTTGSQQQQDKDKAGSAATKQHKK